MVALGGDIMVACLVVGGFTYKSVPLFFGVRMTDPYWGCRVELMEVIEWVRQMVPVENEKSKLDEVLAVYDKLRVRKSKEKAVVFLKK